MRGPRERRLAAGRLAIPARPALAPRGAPKLRGALACETVARERFDGDAARRAVVAPPARFAVAPAAAPPLCGVTAFEELFGLVAARADGRDADEEGRAEEDCAVAEEDDRTVPFGRETRFEGMTMRRSARARARRSSLLGRSSEGLRVAMGARTFRSGLLAVSQLGGQGARRRHGVVDSDAKRQDEPRVDEPDAPGTRATRRCRTSPNRG